MIAALSLFANAHVLPLPTSLAPAAISPPSVAMASILFLVLGDMSAAIIGVSFGREVSTVRIGRGGRKSMEGAVAMFAVCFVIGSTMFASVNLRAVSYTHLTLPTKA